MLLHSKGGREAKDCRNHYFDLQMIQYFKMALGRSHPSSRPSTTGSNSGPYAACTANWEANVVSAI